MDQRRSAELARQLDGLAQCFWAGEAEICRQFWGEPRTSEEQARWLRLQVFKEMYGSGLHANPDGIIRGLLDQARAGLERAQTGRDREEIERTLRVLREEFTHFRLFADILESVTGQPLRQDALGGWQLPQDRLLQEVRQRCREEQGRLGELAIAFTEGGGSAFFYEGRQISGDPVSDQIAEACRVVFSDELEHGEHGAHGVEREIETDADWASVREMVTAICQQRLRMRYDMFGLPIDERRIAEITAGEIEPLRMSA